MAPSGAMNCPITDGETPMKKNVHSKTERSALKPGKTNAPKPLTKTRLRRGEIGRAMRQPTPTAQIIDFFPPVHSDVEDILCDLSGGNPNLDEPPEGLDDSL